MLGQGRGGVVGEVSSVAHNETCETRKIDLDVAEDEQSDARANSKSGDWFRPFPHILVIMLHVAADSGAADDDRLSQNENFQPPMQGGPGMHPAMVVTIPAPSLPHPCTIPAPPPSPTPSPHHPCTMPAQSLHHSCTIPAPAPSLHHPRTIPAPSLHHACPIPAPSLHYPCTIPAPSWLAPWHGHGRVVEWLWHTP